MKNLNKRSALLSILVVVAMLAVGMVASATPRQQDEAVPLIVAFYGPENASAALGLQVAVEEINEAGPFVGGDGVTYRFEAWVTEDPADLREAVAVIALPTENEPETPETLEVPVILLSTGGDLELPGIEAPIFRGLTNDETRFSTLADFIVRFNAFSQITLIGDEDVFGTDFIEFTNLLQSVDAALGIQTLGTDEVSEQAVAEIVANGVEMVVFRGDPIIASAWLLELSTAGWTGVFVYDDAFEAFQANNLLLPDNITVLGMNAWVSSASDPLSSAFIRSFLNRTGQAPDLFAVSAYDLTWAIRLLITRESGDPAELAAALPGTDVINTTRGTLNPPAYGGTELFRGVIIYQLLPLGGAEILARYDDGLLIEEDDVVSALPSPTPLPSATPNVPVVTVVVGTLNVRSGPGLNYDRVTQINEGTVLTVLGVSPDLSWYFVQTPAGSGWVSGQFVSYFGAGTPAAQLPVPQIPPTPTVPPTATGLPPSDIVIDGVTLNPVQPIANQQFTATVTLRNAGQGPTGQFAVAATWNPGGVFSSAVVESIAPGATATVSLQTQVSGTGQAQTVVVADLNGEVTESNEANNNFTINYVVDAARTIEQSNFVVNSTDVNLDGGVNDFTWADNAGMAALTAEPGGTFGVIAGVTYENVTVNQLTSAAISSNAVNATPAATVVGFRTPDGSCGVLRVESYVGSQLTLTYRVYAAASCPA